MQIVHYATDIIQAQMLVSLLQSEGIKARVNGINLLGGAGELPVHNILNIEVATPLADKAKKIIKNYLAADIINSSEEQD